MPNRLPAQANGNVLDQHLFDLNKAGSVHYEEIGEDGFAPIIIAGCTEQTVARLSVLLEGIDKELADLNQRITEKRLRSPRTRSTDASVVTITPSRRRTTCR
ncbi:MAG: hypothetical protein M3N82_02335 [Pseudomonadota bacterium]|nr:hypothetical protein [Pseudomonadota bacterium]